MKILLFGKNGQLGWELQRSLAPLGIITALDRHDTPCGDLSRPADLAATVRALAPDVIVNAAAYTEVDKAETDARNAIKINSAAPALLAKMAALYGIWLVHYSTDYVFNGSGKNFWLEDDVISPLNVYGCSKYAGEKSIRSSGCKHLIFRTSWMFSARGENFAKTVLRLACQRDTLHLVDDQVGAPTPAELVADVTAHTIRAALVDSQLAGTYHVASSGITSRYAYARYLIHGARAAGLPIRTTDDAIKAVCSTAFPTAAKRPANSRLNTNKLRSNFGLHLPHWHKGVERMLEEVVLRFVP